MRTEELLAGIEVLSCAFPVRTSVSLNYTLICGDGDVWKSEGSSGSGAAVKVRSQGRKFPEGTQVCEQRHSNALPCHDTDIREPFLSGPFSVGLKPLSLRALWMGFRGSG